MGDEAGRDTAGFAERLGIRPERADDGQAHVRFEAAEEHLNPAGTLHGGVLATLVDSAMGLAVRSATGDDDVPATSQLTVTQAPSQGPAASPRAVGGEGVLSLTVCDADVEQDGRAIAHAVATFALLHG